MKKSKEEKRIIAEVSKIEKEINTGKIKVYSKEEFERRAGILKTRKR